MRAPEIEDALARLGGEQASVIVTDLEGRIRYWSRGAEAIFGYRSGEVLGRTPQLLYPDASPEELGADLESIAEGRDFVGAWDGRRRDGGRVRVQVRTSALKGARGELLGFIGIATRIEG